MAVRWEKAARKSKSFTDAFDKKERADSLRRLGFDSYSQYIASPLWKSIRARVLDRDGHACVRCKKPAKTVHHSHYGYDVMRGERIEALASACGGCHESCGHSGGGIRPLKPLSQQSKKRLRKEKMQRRKCPGCGVPKNHGLCRKCKRLIPLEGIDQEFREMFSQVHENRWLQLTPLK
jgi:hypothetical protein